MGWTPYLRSALETKRHRATSARLQDVSHRLKGVALLSGRLIRDAIARDDHLEISHVRLGCGEEHTVSRHETRDDCGADIALPEHGLKRRLVKPGERGLQHYEVLRGRPQRVDDGRCVTA